MRRRAVLAVGMLLLAGCENATSGQNAGAAAGGVGGIAVGGLTSNPAVGYAVGLGIRTVVDYTLSSWFRSLRSEEQDAIAAEASRLAPGQAQAWKVEHGLPFGWRDTGGRMEVTRVIETPLASCREVLFSLLPDGPEAPPAGVFAATACRQSRGWKWASAEPAVDRWGALQ
ncbi:hypothetical protein [Teichococcus vastitatis]|jgi:hypothetical protein|uniref:Lipoprotein n=1 Tax=Teichococcus vastitatis TaxID=2307076 RepID=A0ABS9W150_9PROT|nr:hypothetical protein [Pseudoroseomonas vastitatis]MCI0752768.1 hypothetical protein [Pseudoroseomonas vastitatis]